MALGHPDENGVYGAAAIVHDVRTQLARFGMDLVKQVITVMGVHLAVA